MPETVESEVGDDAVREKKGEWRERKEDRVATLIIAADYMTALYP